MAVDRSRGRMAGVEKCNECVTFAFMFLKCLSEMFWLMQQ